MKNLSVLSIRSLLRGPAVVLLAAALFTGLTLWGGLNVSANHPVLVEGETDYDGDGVVGTAEDTDNANDRVFGTITVVLGAANGGAN